MAEDSLEGMWNNIELRKIHNLSVHTYYTYEDCLLLFFTNNSNDGEIKRLYLMFIKNIQWEPKICSYLILIFPFFPPCYSPIVYQNLSTRGYSNPIRTTVVFSQRGIPHPRHYINRFLIVFSQLLEETVDFHAFGSPSVATLKKKTVRIAL